MPPTLKPYLLLAAALAAFAAGWLVNGWRLEARQAGALQEQIDARVKAEQDAATKSEQLEANLYAIRETTRQLNRKLAHETNRPEYACLLPPGGVRLRSEAATGTPGQPDAGVRPRP